MVRSTRSMPSSNSSRGSEIDNLVEALSSSHMDDQIKIGPYTPTSDAGNTGKVDIPSSMNPLKPVKMDQFELDRPISQSKSTHVRMPSDSAHVAKMRVLVVEVCADICVCGQSLTGRAYRTMTSTA